MSLVYELNLMKIVVKLLKYKECSEEMANYFDRPQVCPTNGHMSESYIIQAESSN